MKFSPSLAVSSSFLFLHRAAAAAGQPSTPMTLEDFRLPQADTGVLVYGGSPTIADALAFKAGSNNEFNVVTGLYPVKGQLTTAQVSKWLFTLYGGAYLTKSGDLYTSWPATIGQVYIGRSVTESAPADEYHLAATGVKDFFINTNGMAYISTSGNFFYCGGAITWGGTSNSYYGFQQLGNDSDWISIHGDSFSSYYSSAIIAQKGASEATARLWAIGNNGEGKTGQNTTSGNTQYWSKMSDGLGGTFDVQGWKDVSVSEDSLGAIDNTGRLYRWGEGTYGAAGVGSSTDILFPTQVGSDTDWEKLGTNKLVMMAIKGGEIWYCSSANYGSPFNFNPTFDRTWRQGTFSGGLWEDIKSNTSELQTSSFLAKYNGTWLVYGNGVTVRGNWSSSDLDGTNYAGTRFTELSNHPDYPAGSPTIDWAEFYASSSFLQWLIIRAV